MAVTTVQQRFNFTAVLVAALGNFSKIENLKEEKEAAISNYFFFL